MAVLSTGSGSNGIMHRVARLSVLSLAAAVLGLGSQSARASDADWNAVVEAAKKEGTVTVYAVAGTARTKTALELFEKTTGIRVETLDARPAELRERIRNEVVAGRRIGDVVLTGSTIRNAIPLNIFEKHPAIPNIARIQKPSEDDGYVVPILISTFGLMLNNNMVKAGDEPKSWKDLADPKWKGKILANDPRAVGQGNVTFTVLLEKLGREAIEKMAPNITLATDVSVSERRVAQGEFAMYMAFGPANLPLYEGLPVRAWVPEEGSPYVESVMAMIKNPPHPNAARFLMNWLLSDEGQKIQVDYGVRSVTGVQSDKISEGVKRALQAKLLGQADPLKVNDQLAVMKEIFK